MKHSAPIRGYYFPNTRKQIYENESYVEYSIEYVLSEKVLEGQLSTITATMTDMAKLLNATTFKCSRAYLGNRDNRGILHYMVLKNKGI